jgi:glycosyltransferase involved in cell wall biosynthesis
MNYLKISIITPSYNQGKYIEACIQSVINQNYPNLEYIIIDGGSNDETIDIIKKYDKYIHYWISEKDSGQSDAINKGLKRATGEIVAWLNSDDLYLPHTLSTVAEVFKKNPNVNLIYGDVINFWQQNRKEEYHTNYFEQYDFISRVSIHQPAVFWRRQLHEQIGYLDTSLYYLMDYDLWFRIFFSAQTLKVNKPLAKFRMHNQSKTSGNPKGLYLEYRKILSRFFNSMNDKNIISLLDKLGVYDNSANIKYSIHCNNLSVQKALNIYIHQCAIQEYSWKNIRKANSLFFASIKEPSIFTNSLFLLKNNFFFKYLFP